MSGGFPSDLDAREKVVLDLLEGSAAIGATLREIQDTTGGGTIEVVGTLWSLLAQDRIVRLTEGRSGFPVYVLPGDVRGREIDAKGRQGASNG